MESVTSPHLRAWFNRWLFSLCIFCATNVSALPNTDIVFVGQIPNPTDFATANATFGNHLASVESIVRGGDLFIRYRNGAVRNLTRAAGYGNSGFQGASSIAVRDPSVSWDGKKVVFSMVVGAPTEQYQYGTFFWQLYEITGLAENESPQITKVPFQPVSFNNISPVYGTDDTIFFTTDRPRNGALHLYPQRDEYESQPTNTGLWNLNPRTGEVKILDHAPSGVFEPTVDSFGRIIYTRWDHLQRDQQADETGAYGAFNFADETKAAPRSETPQEVFPEPRVRSLIADPRVNPHDFNHFFPWQINEDGTGHETLNHIGRHELHGYFDRSFNDDDALQEHYGDNLTSEQREIANFFHISEDPLEPGTFLGIDAPEFGTHASGQVLTLSGAPSRSADKMPLTYLTNRATAEADPENNYPEHTGFYRDPIRLVDGSIVVAHTATKIEDENIGSEAAPISRYAFRLKTLQKVGEHWQAGTLLTSGIKASISYFTPDVAASYSGPLWELQPVELIARAKPIAKGAALETPEKTIFDEVSVNVDSFKAALSQRGLALIVMRNITSRDRTDLQQPFNLRVFRGWAESLTPIGKVYDVSHLQLFQGDQIRGYGGVSEPEAGRRIIATFMHDGMNGNPTLGDSPKSSVQVASDGSVAAIVPARRALTWQLTDPHGTPVVRERYWLTFQPGEIRVCASCHGVNSTDQVNRPPPSNKPEALRELLEYLKIHGLPESGEDPGQPPSQKSYLLSVRGKTGGSFAVGERGSISVAIRNSSGPESLDLRLAVDGRRCPTAIKKVVTSTTGGKIIRGTVPNVQRRQVRLLFSAISAGVTVAKRSTKLTNLRSPKSRTQRLRNVEFTRLCAKFSQFR